MTGWKSKWGGILMAVGAAILAAEQIIIDETIKMWMKAVGTAFTTAGLALLGVGIAHKVEKNK
jgi:hypothetical protein